MARSIGAMLKKQSSLWIDDEPKRTKAAGDGTKGRKSDREKREAKESGNDKEKDKDKDKDREKDRDKDREKDRDKDEKNSSTAPASKVRLPTVHPLSLLLPLLVSPLLLLSRVLLVWPHSSRLLYLHFRLPLSIFLSPFLSPAHPTRPSSSSPIINPYTHLFDNRQPAEMTETVTETEGQTALHPLRAQHGAVSCIPPTGTRTPCPPTRLLGWREKVLSCKLIADIIIATTVVAVVAVVVVIRIMSTITITITSITIIAVVTTTVAVVVVIVTAIITTATWIWMTIIRAVIAVMTIWMRKKEITEKETIEKEIEGMTSETEIDLTEIRTPAKDKGRDRGRGQVKGKGTTHTNRVAEIVVVEGLDRVTLDPMEGMQIKTGQLILTTKIKIRIKIRRRIEWIRMIKIKTGIERRIKTEKKIRIKIRWKKEGRNLIRQRRARTEIPAIRRTKIK
jgi:hypothetical protein